MHSDVQSKDTPQARPKNMLPRHGRRTRAGGAAFVSPALQRGGTSPGKLQSRRDGATRATRDCGLRINRNTVCRYSVCMRFSTTTIPSATRMLTSAKTKMLS